MLTEIRIMKRSIPHVTARDDEVVVCELKRWVWNDEIVFVAHARGLSLTEFDHPFKADAARDYLRQMILFCGHFDEPPLHLFVFCGDETHPGYLAAQIETLIALDNLRNKPRAASRRRGEGRETEK